MTSHDLDDRLARYELRDPQALLDEIAASVRLTEGPSSWRSFISPPPHSGSSRSKS